MRRALALKHRIGRLYSYSDAYYLTGVELDLADPFGSARRVTLAQLAVIVDEAELAEAHDTRPGAAREIANNKLAPKTIRK